MYKLMILISLSLSTFSFSDVVDPKKIYVKEKNLYFNDEITEKSALEFSSMLLSNVHDIKKVVVNSYGGSVSHAIDMAALIYEHKLDVEVDKYCGSSCANYIFPAGKRKFINKNSVIFWHGGANVYRNVKEEDIKHDGKTIISVRKWHKKEIDFYEMIGVNPILPYYGQDVAKDFKRIMVNKVRFSDGWFYSVSDMKKLGIKGVVLKNKKWRPTPYLVNLKSLVKISLSKKINENDLVPGDTIIYGVSTKAFAEGLIDENKNYSHKIILDSYIEKSEIFYDEEIGLIHHKYMKSTVHVDKKKLKKDIVKNCSGVFGNFYFYDFFMFSNTDMIYTTHIFFKNGKEKYKIKLYRKECLN